MPDRTLLSTYSFSDRDVSSRHADEESSGKRPLEAEDQGKDSGSEPGPDKCEHSHNSLQSEHVKDQREQKIGDFIRLQITAYLTHDPPLHPRR
jgi:hypothetical protein